MRTQRQQFTSATRPLAAFTLIEILIAIGILSLVIAAIYSSWTAILRSAKVGQDAAAAVQRSRIVLRVLEDSLSSAQNFALNPVHYGFVAENGDEASLSFVARLSKSFPRSGRFGDLDVRRVTFSVDQKSQLVLRQSPLVMEYDIDEKEHPIVLAKNVREFSMMFWDVRKREWIDEWKNTNQIPRLIQFTVKMADSANARAAQEEVSRIISIPAVTVQPMWQMQRMPMVPGQAPPPGAPGTVPPGTVPPAPLPGK
jgi:type II secretion system protein J